ncbi:hypothetical protein CASFOL_011031 [Castilleja foliolosa]|uniref:Uncharacterized protein n=1 Tax=Castilleja foliolosa TaxID=1961234 RepID=A0ABD3DYF5_9LAMI
MWRCGLRAAVEYSDFYGVVELNRYHINELKEEFDFDQLRGVSIIVVEYMEEVLTPSQMFGNWLELELCASGSKWDNQGSKWDNQNELGRGRGTLFADLLHPTPSTLSHAALQMGWE